MPLISIIIPIYNVKDYIEDCLNSVINQTYSNLEIICIDDCGNDASLAVLESIAENDSRIKIIKHQTNKGPACARNAGMELAGGEYIFFLDSDDVMMPDIISKMYKDISEHNADIVVAGYEAFCINNDKKSYAEKVQKSCLKINKHEIFQTSIDNWEEIYMKLPSMVWGILYKKSFLNDNNIRFVNKKAMYEDNGFIIKYLSKMPKISYLPEIGIKYRIRDNSVTMVFDNKSFQKTKYNDIKTVLDDAFEYIKSSSDEVTYSKLLYIVKNSGKFRRYFAKKHDIIYKILWNKYNKIIKIFGIPIFRQKFVQETLITYICGIKI